MNLIRERVRTRRGLFLLLSVIFCLCFYACAGKPQKIFRVGVLNGLDFFGTVTDGFKEKMADLGYVEGKNIVYDVQKTNFDTNAYRKVLAKFISEKVDLIFSFPTEASMEARSAAQGTGIPVVFCNVFTENTGLIKSIREPGGNITGVRWPGPDLALQRLEIMRELAPRAGKFWVPYLKDYPIVRSQVDVLRQAFKSAGLTMIEIAAGNAAELEAALKSQIRSTGLPDAVLLIAEPLLASPDAFKVLAHVTSKHGIPVGGVIVSGLENESVFGLIPQNPPQGRQAAFLADKILKGVPAGTIPVVSAECFLRINYGAAKKLGLKVDDGLLGRANEVIR